MDDMMLLAANGGLPRNGLVALYDPWRDTQGRNILPAGSESFSQANGWLSSGGETITVSDYIDTIPGFGEVACQRIQGLGNGTNQLKWYKYGGAISNPHTITNGVWVKVLSGSVYLSTDNTLSIKKTTNSWELLSARVTISTAQSLIGFKVPTITDTLDILVYHPQQNIGSLAPYSPPSGLPSALSDYSGRGNAAQLGSAAGADTNDPTFSGQGIVIGTDDFCTLTPALFGASLTKFTYVFAFKAPAQSGYKVLLASDSAAEYYAIYNGNLKTVPVYGGVQQSLVSDVLLAQGANYICGVAVDETYFKQFAGITKKITTVRTSKNNNRPARLGNDLGGASSLGSDLYCVAIYNRALSDSEYLRAYAYIKRLMNSRGVTI